MPINHGSSIVRLFTWRRSTKHSRNLDSAEPAPRLPLCCFAPISKRQKLQQNARLAAAVVEVSGEKKEKEEQNDDKWI